MTGQTPQRRLALVLEYAGGAFGGSQRQSHIPTIQGELEAALARLTGGRPRVSLAGRTDAGVHAQGQVAAVTTGSSLDTTVFVRALNSWLPPEIAVRRAVEVPADFDPRRHASSRTYAYTIYHASVRSPLYRTRAWHIAGPLDTDAMQAAADSLVGEHDFIAFSRREDVTTIRCIQRCAVSRQGPLVMVEIEANAFLRQQVRRTAGALAQVGSGRMSAESFRTLLEDAKPSSAGPLAPAHGLCLVRVSYPGLDLHG